MAGELVDLLGRDAERSILEGMLLRRRPAVIVIRGDVGSGKTRLLDWMHDHARSLGWRSLPDEGPGALAVDRSTTEESFDTRLSILLGATAAGTAVDQRRVLDAGELSRELTAGGATSESLAATSAEPRPSPAAVPTDVRLVRQLAALAPVVVLIDGFRSSTSFGAWFADPFLAGIKASGERVVVAIAYDRPRDDEPSLAMADEHLVLGPLERAATAEHFRILGERLDPPLIAEEQVAYAAAAAERPELLVALTRVLELARRRSP